MYECDNTYLQEQEKRKAEADKHNAFLEAVRIEEENKRKQAEL